MELRQKKKKYNSKKNTNPWTGDALNPSQENGKKQFFVLMQPFLQHHHQMVATTLVPLAGGNQSKFPQWGNDPHANVFMCDHEVNIQTRSQSYDVPPSTLDQSESQPNGSLTIEKPPIDIVPRPPKAVLQKKLIILMRE